MHFKFKVNRLTTDEHRRGSLGGDTTASRTRTGRGRTRSEERTSVTGQRVGAYYERLRLRCHHCNQQLEYHDEETLNLAVICLETFVEREAIIAAPQLLPMLQAVTR